MTIIKVAHTSDNHIGPDRFQENMESLIWMARDINEQNCALTTIGGDFYDKRASENDIWLASQFIRELKTETLMLLGNHGTIKGMDIMQNWITGNQTPVKVVTKPEIIHMAGLNVYCMPHMDKSNMQMMMDILGITDSQIAFNEAIDSLFKYFEAESAQSKNNIFVGHFTLQGSKTSTGQELYDPGLSHGFQVRLSTLAKLNMLLASIGHIHLKQILAQTPFPIFYNGGHSRFNHGETEEKGYFVSTIDLQAGKLLDLEFRKNPHAPKLVTERYEFDGQDWNLLSEEQDFADAEVRVIARYLEGSSPDFTELREFYEGQCRKFKIDPELITVTKTRHAEILKATTLHEQVQLYWEHTPDSAPPEDERANVLGLLDEILEGLEGNAKV